MSSRTRGVATWSGRSGSALVSLLLVACSGGDVQVDSPDVSAADAAACESVLDALPDRLADHEEREVRPDGALARAYGDPAIVVVCGVGEPEGFDVGSACEEANGVGWYFPESQFDDQDADIVLTAVDHTPRMQVLVPGDYRPEGVAAVLAQLAGPVGDHLEKTGDCV
ncbi:DUF3515 domain-containing protein [Nocardioides ferulae]|uniref:DUF3515 domain-containing protein n=1 Tax=Nocardioides ferulae TaxID=2340821 RepID=UPI0013DDA6B2|nr:DUF3515 domain-containing protein [Nocardioides ferulae]